MDPELDDQNSLSHGLMKATANLADGSREVFKANRVSSHLRVAAASVEMLLNLAGLAGVCKLQYSPRDGSAMQEIDRKVHHHMTQSV